MKPVFQTILSAAGGNCWHACMASILEIPLESIPNIQQGVGESDGQWYARWQEWLSQFNLQMLSWPCEFDGYTPEDWHPKGYSILGVKPPGCDWLHAVVCLDGKPVWNPMPGYGHRVGEIGKWNDRTVFGVMDPSKPICVGPDGR